MLFCVGFFMFGSILRWEGDLFALQYSGCYVIMLEKVFQNTVAWTQRRRWCFYDDDQQSMEKLSVRFFPSKNIVSLEQINYTPTARNPINAEV